VQRTDTMIVLSSAKETWAMRVPDNFGPVAS
jgi:hypothetical protein